MATDRKVAEDQSAVVGSRPADVGPSLARPALSRTAVVTSVVVGILLVAWFFFAWLALDHDIVDAAGESIGSAFAILLLVSLVGAFRHNRHRR